jgi:hypothetical protein
LPESASVPSLLIVINLVFVPTYLWFFYLLIGWGISLGMHYLFEVRFVRKLIEDQQAKVEYRAKQILARAPTSPSRM